MNQGGTIDSFFRKNYLEDAINIYSIKGNLEISKEEVAKNILNNGIKLTDNNTKISQVINPKGLVKNINKIDDALRNNILKSERDVCNVVIGTPQIISLGSCSYFIGYPRDNVTGYTTAKYQKDYDCLLTDYLEKQKTISKEMIIGYYYKDKDGKETFQENKSHYSKLTKEEQTSFFTKLIDKIDGKIQIGSNQKEILKYIEDSIKNQTTDNNSKYQTSLEYIEYQDKKIEEIDLTKEEFINLIRTNYNDYAMYLHGVDQNPKFSKVTVDFILRSCLHIDEEYGFSGTCEPCGPVDEITSIAEAVDYHYGDNHEESYNIIILTPKVLEDMEHNAYFVGYSRKNTTGTFPKSMKDFDCILTDRVNELGYIPQEFIFGYHVYGPNIEDKFYINPKHYSFLSDDLKQIFSSKFINTPNKKLKENIELFIDSNTNDEIIDSYRNPLIMKNKLSSMQTTSEEYFEFINSKKNKKDSSIEKTI